MSNHKPERALGAYNLCEYRDRWKARNQAEKMLDSLDGQGAGDKTEFVRQLSNYNFYLNCSADRLEDEARYYKRKAKLLLKAFIVATVLLTIGSSVFIATAEAARKSSCANTPEKAVRACIWHAAKKYEVSYDTLLRKARCESGLNPKATNGTHMGLFQFLPSTYATTPYADRSPWRAKWNSLAAAWMHSVGRGGEWTCQ